MSKASFVSRLPVVLRPNPARVVVRPFSPTVEPRNMQPNDVERARRVVDGVLALSDAQLAVEIERVLADFSGRHRDIARVFKDRYAELAPMVTDASDATPDQALLIGSYFAHEYSFMAAALFNPSIVPHPDQSGVPDGTVRFVMSLRGVGEGHISSITFRTGAYSSSGAITIDSPGMHASVPRVHRHANDGAVEIECTDDISECVIFPVTPAQRNGLEDLRLVRFVEENGSARYIGTYTAFSGSAISSEMMTTDDFKRFELSPMEGDATKNKGMALFPRRVNGRYAMLGRKDNETIWFLQSDEIKRWDGGVRVIRPRYPWEFTQMGNCGSPVEVDEGWIVITHGVGAVRNYAIGACLLDKNDPSKLLARTPKPLIRPDWEEREGYVPNVAYTCGAMVHGRTLLLPYALADSLTTFASMPVDKLLASMA